MSNQERARSSVSRRTARGLAVVIGGTAGGQIIMLLASPLLTRLYDPRAFGEFALFVSLSVVLAILASLRMELAVPVVPEGEVLRIVWAGLVSSLVAAGMLAVIAATCATFLGDLLGVSPQVFYWLPISVMALAGTAIISQLMVRQRRYSRYAIRKLVQAIAVVGAQCGLGFLVLGVPGMLVGYVLGQVIVLITLMSGSGIGVRSVLHNIRLAPGSIARHRRYPLTLAPAGILNALGTQIPVFLILALYGPVIGGFYGLAQRVLAAPVGLIGTSVAQVYLGEMAAKARFAPHTLPESFRRTSIALWSTALLLGVLITISAPSAFAVAFGEDWADSGRFAQVLAIGIVGQLAAAPLSQTLVIAGMLMSQLVWDGVRAAFTALAVVVPATLGWTPTSMMVALSVVQVIMYLLLWSLCRKAATTIGRRESSPSELSGW